MAHNANGGQRKKIDIGMWRSHEDPIQIISGPVGKWKVHFEAPPFAQLEKEMDGFIRWFNRTAPDQDDTIKNPVVRSAIAHLYFESIHPFEDGNGRIGRPILLSLSEAIEAKKKDYYNALKNAQKSNEISGWIKYFANMALTAQTTAEEKIEFFLNKTKYFDRFKDQFNARHLKVIRKMLDAGVSGFEGGMTQKKYVAICKTSTATATRDLKYLSDIGALKQVGGGRSTRYEINFGEW